MNKKDILDFLYSNSSDNHIDNYLKGVANTVTKYKDKIKELEQDNISLREEISALKQKLSYITTGTYYSNIGNTLTKLQVKVPVKGVQCVNCKGKKVFLEGHFKGQTCISCNGTGIIKKKHLQKLYL